MTFFLFAIVIMHYRVLFSFSLLAGGGVAVGFSVRPKLHFLLKFTKKLFSLGYSCQV